jgi:hypothetical protein
VTYMPAMIRIDGEGKMEFKMDEISEALGREMTPHLFEISTSTHEGFKGRVATYIERIQFRREAPWTRSARTARVSI